MRISLSEDHRSLTSMWRRWPRWCGPLAAFGAAGYGGVLAVLGSAGSRLFGVPGLIWVMVTVLAVGSFVTLVTINARRTAPVGRAWAVVLGAVTVVLLAASSFVLLDLIQLVVDGTLRGRDGSSDVGPFVERVGFAALAVPFLLSTIASTRCRCGSCPRCTAHDRRQPTREPDPAPAWVRTAAHVGCLSFVPYYGCHLMRFAGMPPFDGGRLADRGDLFIPIFIICTAIPAETLLLGLVHRFGLVFPRWVPWLAGRSVPRLLPLIPAWLVAPTLALYGTGAWVYVALGASGVVDDHTRGVDYLLGCAAATAFACYGWALVIAAWSYTRRTTRTPSLQPSDDSRAGVGRHA